MWHRIGWLYNQWSCGTDHLTGCFTSGIVAQAWLVVSPVGLWLILTPMGCSHPKS